MKDDGYYEAAWREMEGTLKLQIGFLEGELEEAEERVWEYSQAYLNGRIFSLETVLYHVREIMGEEGTEDEG